MNRHHSPNKRNIKISFASNIGFRIAHAAMEKHVPDVTVDGNKVNVVIGSTEHPMLPEHHITNIWLETTAGVQRANLDPEGKPAAEFILPEGVSAIAAYEYCNLHGFWKKEL